ncbi:hypothetical protein DWB77_04336 [Streptomyces hundungensis]|uniref:ATP-binding protein n=2 Tax=Streptomyces hundungensis TaxID=1077946 RepID=A0A387HE93_9ACTN|nr:hypothetical protein [Streptomyces hundungensis]AYG82166.1 hypothetical protein DWB77_04336 [Streptomyces hundungensis]
MKSMKVAAAVAGSLAVMGAAAPAFAAGGTPPMPPMSLNGGLDSLTNAASHAQLADAAPVNTSALDPKSDGSVLHAVTSAAHDLNKSHGGSGSGRMLGGLPIG